MSDVDLENLLAKVTGLETRLKAAEDKIATMEAVLPRRMSTDVLFAGNRPDIDED